MEFNTKGKKNCDTHASFIRKIRQWRPDSCSCRTSKNFIPNVGFIERNQLQVLEVLPRNNSSSLTVTLFNCNFSVKNCNYV